MKPRAERGDPPTPDPIRGGNHQLSYPTYTQSVTSNLETAATHHRYRVVSVASGHIAFSWQLFVVLQTS